MKDIILSVDGIAMENSTQFTEYLNRSTGETLSVVVSRNGNQVTLAVTPQLVEQENRKQPYFLRKMCMRTSQLCRIGIICLFREYCFLFPRM